MSLWQQNYDPAGNIWLSSLIASLPILFFFFALIKLKLKGYLAATYTVAIALMVALFFYKMPVDRALASVVYGFFYGLWPIAWIIIAAVFVYKISVKTGQFDIIRSSILSITPDQRLQMLIVGFSFGAFLEGAAGFGAPVAITAALLVGLGFNPLYAAGLCLIVNTAPVAFGAMGIPILVAGQVTGLDSFEIGQMDLACGNGSGRFVRHCPVSQLQLPRPGTAGHHLFPGVAGLPDAVPETLAAGTYLPLC